MKVRKNEERVLSLRKQVVSKLLCRAVVVILMICPLKAVTYNLGAIGLSPSMNGHQIASILGDKRTFAIGGDSGLRGKIIEFDADFTNPTKLYDITGDWGYHIAANENGALLLNDNWINMWIYSFSKPGLGSVTKDNELTFPTNRGGYARMDCQKGSVFCYCGKGSGIVEVLKIDTTPPNYDFVSMVGLLY